METIEALTQILAINSWMRLPLAKDGRPFGPGYFRGRNWRDRLVDKNRKVAFRLREYGQCLACNVEVPKTSTGDHLIPLSLGGPPDASNYVPLCRSCNASKGNRDFFIWWQAKGYRLRELPKEIIADLLCAYARLRYEMGIRADTLDTEAPEHLQTLVIEAKQYVPKSHWKALESV